MRPVSCEGPRCPTCNSRMACFQDNSWRCPKCAPQAQEETRGPTNAFAYELGLVRPPQPPAPASPAALVWTKQKPKADGFYWKRCPAVADTSEPCQIVEGTLYLLRAWGRSNWPLDEYTKGKSLEWAGPIPEPADPEAGAPGTQEGGSQP